MISTSCRFWYWSAYLCSGHNRVFNFGYRVGYGPIMFRFGLQLSFLFVKESTNLIWPKTIFKIDPFFYFGKRFFNPNFEKLISESKSTKLGPISNTIFRTKLNLTIYLTTLIHTQIAFMCQKFDLILGWTD